jgi:hypothetical protein
MAATVIAFIVAITVMVVVAFGHDLTLDTGELSFGCTHMTDGEVFRDENPKEPVSNETESFQSGSNPR